jgi:capsular exopolysaccharide synthesis family protein
MSIVDALEKAKRLGKERAIAEAAVQQRPVDAASGDAPAAHAPRREVPPPIARPVKPLGLPRRLYDASACLQNRIMVPEADARANKGVLPGYRLLRTRVLQRARASRWSTLAVTSAGPGEGKSVTALNLAISLAREGNQDVFLLDCDMRNPSLCRYIGVEPPAEISDYFRGKASVHDLLFDIGIEHLALAGGVTSTDSASELLANGRFEELLREIRPLSVNPLILVDLPPMINTDDALVVAPRVDALVLVAAEGLTRRDELEKALGLLAEYPIAGVILNRTAEAAAADYYGSKY